MILHENRAIIKEKITSRDGLLHLALSAMTLSSKNIYNTALYHIHNAFLLNKADPSKEIFEHSQTALDRYNMTIDKVNAARTLRAGAKPPKLLKLIEVGAAPSSVLLDATVLDTLIRNYCPDYKAIPATTAQQVLRQVTSNYKSYFKALADYAIHPEKYKAKPHRPQYLAKRGLNFLRFNANAGKVSLGSLKHRIVYLDYDRTKQLPQEAIEYYNNYEEANLINRAKSRYASTLSDSLNCVEIRIIPKRGDFTVECVFEKPVNVEDATLLGQVALKYVNDNENKTTKDFFALSLKSQSALIKQFINKHKVMPATAGIDLGLNNLATVAYSTGNKGSVYSGTRFNARMRAFDKQLDMLKSVTMSNAALELDALETIPEEKRPEYYTELNKVYSLPEYRKLSEDKAAFVSSAVHRLSSAIVTQAMIRGIEVIVIGKNEGWKSEINIGRRNNRQFHNIPHAKLIEQIQYKAREQSIAVVVTEEAYTSKASFVLSDAIPPKASSNSTTCSGTRNKHKYSLRKSLKDKVSLKWQEIHADINGAFNMIRKVIKQFSFEDYLTPNYRLIYSRSDSSFTPSA